MGNVRRGFNLIFVLGFVGVSGATEYFVSTLGSDANDGMRRESAFASVQRGVDALAPGDTLTLLPGEYFGGAHRRGLGNDDATTTIRAEIPGTVLLRGDVPAPEFEPVEGYRFVFAADFDRPVQAVNEVDTLRVLPRLPSLSELEFRPGACYQNPETGRLYLSTSDLLPPRRHRYTVSVIEARGGLFLHHPVNVLIKGLSATGFHSAGLMPRMQGGLSDPDARAWGFYLSRSRQCEIRGATAYLNGGGIAILSGAAHGNNRISQSVAYGNAPTHGIIIYQPHKDLMAHLVAFHNQGMGLEFYAGGGETSLMRDSLAWDNRAADIQLKAGGPHEAERIVGVGQWAQETRSDRVRNSLIGAIRDIPVHFIDNIVPAALAELSPEAEFADPDNLDFRLQATSRFRGAALDGGDLGPHPYKGNVFFVKPNGDDQANGRSLANAWGTLTHALQHLTPGSTLYLAPGRYAQNLSLDGSNWQGDAPVSIRGRGLAPVILTGTFSAKQVANLSFKRLHFVEPVTLSESRDVTFKNCRFSPDSSLEVRNTKGLRVEHCEFAVNEHPAITARASVNLFIRGTLFAGGDTPVLDLDTADAVAYSDYNSYPQATALWSIDRRAHDLHHLPGHHERHASVVSPVFETSVFPVQLQNEDAFAALGPNGMPIGINRPRKRLSANARDTLRVAGPFVRSVTDTTANLEWWVSGPSDCRVAWGQTPPQTPGASIHTHRFASYSLTGLDPDTDYHLRIDLEKPITPLDMPKNVQLSGNTLRIAFRTESVPPQPRNWYVAPEGNDRHSGISRREALLSVNRAAALARAGDTIKIAGGTYQESVRIRTTGDQGRPLTFKALSGEQVVFDGGGRALSFAFLAADKHHLVLDGFYFRSMGRGGPTPWADERYGNGSIVLYRGSEIEIRRCFHDGRGAGYGPGLLQAIHSRSVAVRNSVICDAMGGGISFYACPDLRIEHNVFLRNKIQNIAEGVNQPDQPFYIKQNIFTDNLPGKVNGALFAIGKVESMQEDRNLYVFRIPGDERRAFQFYGDVAYSRPAESWGMRTTFPDPAATPELTQMTFPEYREAFNPRSTSTVGDPGFAAAKDIDSARDYRVDALMGKRDLDFPDLFATQPDIVEKEIGLQPQAFEDFHFNVAER